jgi:drug/metabolite transporter (DMT)-like permease
MNRALGIVFIIISAASFGTLAIFGRYAYAAGLDTFTLLFLRFTFSALIMSGWLILRREGVPRGKPLALLMGMGAIGYVGQSFCYLTATRYASAGLVALLLYLFPSFVASLAIIFLKEKLTRVKVMALALATTGVALLVDLQGGQGTGILLAISAAAIYSVYIIVGAGVLKQVSARSSSTIIFASAGLVYGVLMALNGARWPTTGDGWLTIAAITLIATIIPVTSFLAGLQRIGPTDASMLSTLEPVVTVVLAALLFQEELHWVTLLGGGLILAAVILLTRSELRRAEVATTNQLERSIGRINLHGSKEGPMAFEHLSPDELLKRSER